MILKSVAASAGAGAGGGDDDGAAGAPLTSLGSGLAVEGGQSVNEIVDLEGGWLWLLIERESVRSELYPPLVQGSTISLAGGAKGKR